MTDAYLDSLIGEQEEILLVTHQHWFTLLQSILMELIFAGIIVALVLAVGAFALPGNPLVPFGFLLLLIPLASLTRDVLIWNNRKYIVTTHRVIQIAGIVNKSVTDSSLEKVNDVKMDQSFFGRIFDFGDIEILTASELGVNRFHKIAEPVRFKSVMLNAKQNLEADELPRRAPRENDIPAMIAQLSDLRNQGIITQEEFQRKKNELLSKI